MVKKLDNISNLVIQDGLKMMIGGQLCIKRGENLYSAQGAVVK